MKFSDIQQFPHASYTVNVPWRHLCEWLNQDGIEVDLDPEYQRGYVWTDAQKQDYITYILRGGFSGKDIFWNCTSWNHGLDTPMQIVDGKQRLSAVQDFLSNKIICLTDLGGFMCSEFDDEPCLLRHSFKMHVNCLQSEIELVEWYIAMNTGGSIHTLKDLSPAYEMLKRLEENNGMVL